jgi:hypothetical protein
MEKLNNIPVASSTHGTGSSKKRLEMIATRGKMLSSSYRLDQFRDPDAYVLSIASVLEAYPDEVIFEVTDPRTGIQRGCKWPPTIAEVVSACEVRMQHLAKIKRYRNWGKPEVPAIEAPREERPTLEQLKAKYGEHYGLAPPPPKPPAERAPSWQTIVAMYKSDPARIRRLMRIADDYADDRGDAPA